MKCTNCGADLQTDQEQQLRFCPYCGNKIEIEEKVPDTMAGALYGTAKNVLKHIETEKKAQREYNEKRRAENDKKAKPAMIISVALLVLLFVYIHFQAERERAEKAVPTATPTSAVVTVLA